MKDMSRSMKMKKFSFGLLLLLVVANSLSGCITREIAGERKFVEDKIYIFNAGTIFQEISLGKTNLFTLSKRNPNYRERDITWDSKDYLVISTSFANQAWGENISSWNFEEVRFYVKNDGDGYVFSDGGVIVFQDTIKDNKVVFREVRRIDITPSRNTILLTIFNNSSYYQWQGLKQRYALNLDHVISAEEALVIAEANGGKEFMANFQNDIGISMYLEATNGGGVWKIYYFSPENNRLRMVIDAITLQVISIE